MANWMIYTVQQLIDLGMLEEPLDGNHGGLHPKTSDYKKEGIPFIMANDLVNGEIDFNNCAFISEEKSKTLRKGFARPGDVLLTHKATMGRTAIVSNQYPLVILTPQVTYYRTKKGILNKYLKYYFDSPLFQKILNNWANAGSTRAYLGITSQRKLPIELPSITIQQKIVDIIDSLDKKIKCNTCINKNLSLLSNSIYKETFLNFKDNLPKSWKLGTLNELATITSGKRPVVKSLEKTNSTSIPIIGASSIMGYTSTPNQNEQIIIVGRVGTLGIVQRCNYPCWTSDNTLVIKTKYYEYIYQILRNYDFYSINRGSTQPLITQGDLNKIEIAIPERHIIDEFERKSSSLMTLYEKNIVENNYLEKVRDSLLPKLISGEINVSDITLSN